MNSFLNINDYFDYMIKETNRVCSSCNITLFKNSLYYVPYDGIMFFHLLGLCGNCYNELKDKNNNIKKENKKKYNKFELIRFK